MSAAAVALIALSAGSTIAALVVSLVSAKVLETHNKALPVALISAIFSAFQVLVLLPTDAESSFCSISVYLELMVALASAFIFAFNARFAYFRPLMVVLPLVFAVFLPLPGLLTRMYAWNSQIDQCWFSEESNADVWVFTTFYVWLVSAVAYCLYVLVRDLTTKFVAEPRTDILSPTSPRETEMIPQRARPALYAWIPVVTYLAMLLDGLHVIVMGYVSKILNDSMRISAATQGTLILVAFLFDPAYAQWKENVKRWALEQHDIQSDMEKERDVWHDDSPSRWKRFKVWLANKFFVSAAEKVKWDAQNRPHETTWLQHLSSPGTPRHADNEWLQDLRIALPPRSKERPKSRRGETRVSRL